jgi:hypothetical protein
MCESAFSGRPGGLQRQSPRFGEQENQLYFPGSERRNVQSAVRSLVNILTVVGFVMLKQLGKEKSGNGRDTVAALV